MFKTRICPVLAVLVLAMAPVAAWGAGTGVGNVTVSCTVDEFFEWPAAMTVTVPNITATSQTHSSTATFTCKMNHANATAITIAAAADTKNGVLTETGGKTLTTTYGIDGTGILLANRDGVDGSDAVLAPGAFFAKSYNVIAAAGDIEVKLTVTAASGANAANLPKGAYTCGIVLTATW